MIETHFDREHVPAPLAVDQGESSWVCCEVTGLDHRSAPRRFAVLAWLHRTGPRLVDLHAGPGLLDRSLLPNAVRGLVPSWLPILSPMRVHVDDRPLLLVVLYDLDHPERPPLHLEQEIEHAAFERATFSGASRDLSLLAGDALTVTARLPAVSLQLELNPSKPPVQFGDRSPYLAHGDIEVGYLQRSRLRVHGRVTIGGESLDVSGSGAHDRHWRTSSVQDLAWLWLHLRMPGDREVNCYVIRSSRTSHELGRGGWWIDADARVHDLGAFVLASHGASYVFDAAAIATRLDLVHAVAAPRIPLRAFGAAIDGVILEAPIRPCGDIEGWLEVFDSSACTVKT